MGLHYLNPDDEPRECPARCEQGWHRNDADTCSYACESCYGTGLLGDPEAKPDVDVFYGKIREVDAPGWLYDTGVGFLSNPQGPFPTEAAALTAAREANNDST